MSTTWVFTIGLSTLKSRIIVYVQLFFRRKNSILYSLIRVCTIINFWCWPSYTMLIWACMIIRIQPFNQQFFCPLKVNWWNHRKMKPTLLIPNGSAAFFISRIHTVMHEVEACAYTTLLCGQRDAVVYHFLLFHTILLFHPILLLTFRDSSTLYYYFILYSGLLTGCG